MPRELGGRRRAGGGVIHKPLLDKLIEVLLQFLDRILPAYVVKQYQAAVHFRWGRFLKVTGPGLHWKIPIADDVDHHLVATTTLTLPAQSVTTIDGVSVVVKAHVKYAVTDVAVYGTAVTDAIDALSDVTCGIIHEAMRELTWDNARATDLSSRFTKDAKREAKQWGISVSRVTVTDLAQMRSIRLFNEGSGKAIDRSFE